MSYSIDQGLERLIYQYQSSPRLKGLIEALLAEYGAVGAVLAELRTRLSIEVSEGIQLDGIGEIVGRARPLTVQIAPEDAFSFDGPAPGGGFSGVGRPDVGGRFVGVNGLIIGAMPDEQYRVLLRAIIFSNYATSTLDNISRYGNFVLGADINVSEGVGFVDISVGRPLSRWELDIVRETIPIAAGIRLGNITFALGEGAFGFAGDPRNGGFGGVVALLVDEDGAAISDDTAPGEFWTVGDPGEGAGFVGIAA